MSRAYPDTTLLSIFLCINRRSLQRAAMSGNPVAGKEWNEAEHRARVLTRGPGQRIPGDISRAMRRMDVGHTTRPRVNLGDKMDSGIGRMI